MSVATKVLATLACGGLLFTQAAQADLESLAGNDMSDPLDAQHKILPVNPAYQAIFTRNMATERAKQSVEEAEGTAQGSVIITGPVRGNIYNAPVIRNTGPARK